MLRCRRVPSGYIGLLLCHGIKLLLSRQTGRLLRFFPVAKLRVFFENPDEVGAFEGCYFQTLEAFLKQALASLLPVAKEVQGVRMAIDGVSGDAEPLRQLACVGPVNLGRFNGLALGMGTDGTLRLMPPKTGAQLHLRWGICSYTHNSISFYNEGQSH